MKLALVPLNSTDVAPVKFVPLIVTLVPADPLPGVKLVIVGGLMTVKLPALLPVPAEVVTLIGPLEAPAGTAAVIAVAELTVNDVALVPLNCTAVAPVKLVPLRVTLVPTGPLGGVKLEMVGGLETVTVTGLDVHSMPNPSRATAVRAWELLLAVVVFQETEYGAEVSSPPRLAPSSLNWTPATVRVPTMVTLAVTGTVLLTVDPEAGAVTVTTRLPNCAWAGCGAIQPQPTSADRAVA